MTKLSCLNNTHTSLNGKMVDFHGWLLPLHYGSQLIEHQKVREEAGIFDVSHMTPIAIKGPQSLAFLRHLLANDVKKLSQGQALYSAMLNHEAGIIDDLIVYFLRLKITTRNRYTQKEIPDDE